MVYCGAECAEIHWRFSHSKTCSSPPEKCPVCFDGMAAPIDMPCGHSMCQECLCSLLAGRYTEVAGGASSEAFGHHAAGSAELNFHASHAEGETASVSGHFAPPNLVCPICRDGALE